MNELHSINQLPDTLPNFRNMGVILRILLLCGGMAVMSAFLQANSWLEVMSRFMQISSLLTPVMLFCLLLLWIIQSRLNQCSYRQGMIIVNLLAITATLLVYNFGGELYSSMYDFNEHFAIQRYFLISAAMCNFLLLYFNWRTRILSHALHDAKLQILRARIRPHFLFNTINAVLGIVRTKPKLAETALEDMADLFRMAMADERDMIPLHKEVSLCRQYLALEQLRLGERLIVNWNIQDVADDVLIPVLLLQPLLDNAVYHGIENLTEGGIINVLLSCTSEKLRIMVDNPRVSKETSHNKLALQNIRERLAMLFDVEADYRVENGLDYYRVKITIPLIRNQKT
jgi:two-component system sensor histidine kinase AlgZ